MSNVANCKDVQEYYLTQSFKINQVSNVKIPLLGFHALDDPITASHAQPFTQIQSNPYIVLANTLHGGHLGWFNFEGFSIKKRWIRKPVAEFFNALFELDPSPGFTFRPGKESRGEW